jgi:hypothetical protein
MRLSPLFPEKASPRSWYREAKHDISWSTPGFWQTIRSTPLRDRDQTIRLFEGTFFENLSQLAQKSPETPLGLCPRSEGKDSVARGFLAADGRVGVVVRNYSDKPHAVRVSAEGCKHLGVYAPGETEPVGETKPVAADSVRFYLWCVKKT